MLKHCTMACCEITAEALVLMQQLVRQRKDIGWAACVALHPIDMTDP
jgi:hypothetical protein